VGERLLSETSKAEIRKLRKEFAGSVPDDPRLRDVSAALLPALELAQRDYGGWLPEEALAEVGALMELPPAQVAAVASFYTMLNLKPVGRHLVQVCTNVSCSLLGAEHLVVYIARRLGIEPGETTPDGKFTLLEVECLGSCGTAPMMQLDDTYYEGLTEQKIEEILESLS
jgi:NADH-quinone oxidoreductase E subunit